jgi:hypothetical protein
MVFGFIAAFLKVGVQNPHGADAAREVYSESAVLPHRVNRPSATGNFNFVAYGDPAESAANPVAARN